MTMYIIQVGEVRYNLESLKIMFLKEEISFSLVNIGKQEFFLFFKGL